MQRDELVEKVLGCAIEVHRALGPGLLETAYHQCLAHELHTQHIAFSMEVPVPVTYKGIQLECGYRRDLFVENRLILELKAVEKLLPIHEAQLLTYMKLMQVKQGLLLNFNTPKLRDGMKSMLLKSSCASCPSW